MYFGNDVHLVGLFKRSVVITLIRVSLGSMMKPIGSADCNLARSPHKPRQPMIGALLQ